MLASCVDPLSFGYDTKGGRWVKKGEAWGGDNNFSRRLAKQMLMHLVSKHNSILILPRHTLPLLMTHSACKERHSNVSSSSYSANSKSGRAKLQQPHQQGDAQAHMIRRNLPELSNL